MDNRCVECCDYPHTHEEIINRVQHQMPGEEELYDLAELSRQPLEAEKMTEFIRRSMEIVEMAAQL